MMLLFLIPSILVVHSRALALYWPRVVDAIRVPLIQVDKENQIVSEYRQSVHGGHANNECKEIYFEKRHNSKRDINN